MADPEPQQQKPYEYEIEIGRPSKFNQEAIDKTEKYIEHKIKTKQFATIQELAIKLGVSDDVIADWQKPRAKDDKIIKRMRKDFSGAIKRLKNYQKLHLIVSGLGGKATPSVAIFLLKSVHGLKEVSQIELGTIDGDVIERDRDENRRIADSVVANLKKQEEQPNEPSDTEAVS